MNHVRSQPALDAEGNALFDEGGQIIWEQVTVSTPWTAQQLIAEIKALRADHESKGALLPDGRRLQTDPFSITKILGLIKVGELQIAAGQPFSVRWNLGNGEVLVMDLPAVISNGLLQFEHVRRTNERYGDLRGMIQPNSTQEQLNAVAAQMQLGWPD